MKILYMLTNTVPLLSAIAFILSTYIRIREQSQFLKTNWLLIAITIFYIVIEIHWVNLGYGDYLANKSTYSDLAWSFFESALFITLTYRNLRVVSHSGKKKAKKEAFYCSSHACDVILKDHKTFIALLVFFFAIITLIASIIERAIYGESLIIRLLENMNLFCSKK